MALNISKYSTTCEFNKFSSTIFDENLKQADFKTKADIADLIKKTYFVKKTTLLIRRLQIKQK